MKPWRGYNWVLVKKIPGGCRVKGVITGVDLIGLSKAEDETIENNIEEIYTGTISYWLTL